MSATPKAETPNVSSEIDHTANGAVRVRDLMTPPVAVAEPSTRVRHALELMRLHQVRHLPIVTNGNLEGFLSRNDLRETLGFQTEDWQQRERLDWAVLRVMNEDGPRLFPDTTIGEAIDLFLATKEGAIPVVTSPDNQLVGILSTIDILRSARDRF
jgi:CBS domain-containing protein